MHKDETLEGPALDVMETRYFLTCVECFRVFNPPSNPGECPGCLAVDSLKLTKLKV